jgi:hypothetical protein
MSVPESCWPDKWASAVWRNMCLRLQCGVNRLNTYRVDTCPTRLASALNMDDVSCSETYVSTHVPTRLYDITAQKVMLSLQLLSSCYVKYRFVLNRREGVRSTLTCACSCCASLALSSVVHTLHATRCNTQACFFQWPSLATVLIALPQWFRADDAIHDITTEHQWNTRCLNVKLLWNNCH